MSTSALSADLAKHHSKQSKSVVSRGAYLSFVTNSRTSKKLKIEIYLSIVFFLESEVIFKNECLKIVRNKVFGWYFWWTLDARSLL